MFRDFGKKFFKRRLIISKNQKQIIFLGKMMFLAQNAQKEKVTLQVIHTITIFDKRFLLKSNTFYVL